MNTNHHQQLSIPQGSSASGRDPKNHNPKSSSSFPRASISRDESQGMKNIEQYILRTLIDGKQWYSCKWQNCTYSTTRSDSIVRHMRKHTGERPYKCWFCSYATIQSSGLKIHLRRHTGEKPYLCKFSGCGKRFTVLKSLVIHERTHIGTRPYKCTIPACNYAGKELSNLICHMRTVHHIDEVLSGRNVQMVNNTFSQPAFPSHNPPPLTPNCTSTNHSTISTSIVAQSPLFLSSAPTYTTLPAQQNHQISMNNGLSNSQLKHCATTSPFVPLNLLSVIPSGTNYENIQNNSTPPTAGQSKRKAPNRHKTNKKIQSHQIILNSSTPSSKRENNSIKRVILLVDKRMVNNRTSYLCKWPDCGYESFRSDSIVRHMRSHTGERPYKCNYENCNYATIQQSTLNKHLSRHLNSIYSLS